MRQKGGEVPEERREKNPLAERAGQHLRRARERLDYTQEGVAEAAGIEAGTYGSYERGWVLVTSEALIKLRPVLRQTTDYMLGLDDPSSLSLDERRLVECFRNTRSPRLRKGILDIAQANCEYDQATRPLEGSKVR